MELEKKLKPEIVYQDDYIVIVDKPAGLIVHYNKYSRKEANVINYLGGYLQQKIYTIHRLDRGTSGMMIFARSSEIAGAISKQFMERSVTKKYLALLKGDVQDSFSIEQPIKNKFNKEIVSATTILKPIRQSKLNNASESSEHGRFTLVSLDLVTGRPHQARIHCQSIEHPVIGDNSYGDKIVNQQFVEDFGIEEMLLRSFCLELRHPVDNKTMTFWAGFSESWLNAFQKLGIDLEEEVSDLILSKDFSFLLT